MKKLIMMTAVVCVACFANAGNYKWGLTSGDFYNHEGGDPVGGTAFLYLGTVTASESAFNLSGATYLNMADFDEDKWEYGGFGALLTDNAVTPGGSQAWSIVVTENTVSTLTDYEGYYTIVTGTAETKSIPGATVTYYESMTDGASAIQTSSYMSAVPEPTSGLLLLLGVAGLALKRRRA